MSLQLDLFGHVTAAYAEAAGGELDNKTLYRQVAARAGITAEQLEHTVYVSGQDRSPIKRAIRWHQQTLKHLGVLARDETQRGVWRFAEGMSKDLHRLQTGIKLEAFSTNLGVAVWSACEDVFPSLGMPIALCVTSVPYFLRKPRAYGNPIKEEDYREFIVRAIEPVAKSLVPGGSICLNLTNDAFDEGMPSRSLYRERLLLDLCDELKLHKMDELIWHNPSKPPGPVRWASMARVQLNVSYEPIYWLTNDPTKVRADNRAVLTAHTEKHRKFLDRVARNGQCDRKETYGDGAYRLRATSYTNVTPGSIPRNVLRFGHSCADTAQYRKDAIALGLPVHGAMMPLSVPDFLIRFLSKPDDLVVDPFGGTVTTGMAAERLGRRWIVTELIYEYLRAGAQRFRACAGFDMDPAFARARGV